jgi:hypothetical protein
MSSRLDYDDFVAGALVLYEITHDATKSYFSLPRSSEPLRDRASALQPSLIEEKMALILRVDGSLDRWKKSLPTHLRYADEDYVKDDVSTRQATILHLR